jgi:hypothetical protein
MLKKRSLGMPIFLKMDQLPGGAEGIDGTTAASPPPYLLTAVSTAQDSEKQYQEELLQEVIHLCPGVLPINDFYSSATDLISLGREIPVDLGSSTGYIDNLFVTNDAHLVLVETKLHRNPEATREVIAQTLQYGMAVSRLSLDEFEECIRRSSSKGKPLGKDETIVRRVTDAAAKSSNMELMDDFEETFDRSRRDGEILLLIVTDGIHSSAERLVQWMNKTVGSAPYKFGLVELGMFDLADGGRIVVPKTRLRITEASRHVVTVKSEAPGRELSYTVTSPQSPPRKGATASSEPISDETLTNQILNRNAPDVSEMVRELRSQLDAISPQVRATPSTIQYGVHVKGDFIPLLSFGAEYIWFQIPVRAVRCLGPERFVVCKQKVNAVAPFYRPEDVADPDKTNALNPRYEILAGKVEAFVEAFSQIVEIVKGAVEETS